MIREHHGIQIERFEDANGLIDALSRRQERWRLNPNSWIFRGQANADWDLVPSAFRPEVAFEFGPKDRYVFEKSHHQQMVAEAKLVRAFLAEMDRQGLPLPSDSSWRWNDFMRMVDDLMLPSSSQYWPPVEIAPLFALAQHHGVPTRLLDWTSRPLIAAYFAAVEAAAHAKSEAQDYAHLAIWAMNVEQSRAIIMVDPEKSRQPELKTVHAPRATNANLRAQEGSFTLLVDNTRGWNDGSAFPPLNRLLSERISIAQDRGVEVRRAPLRRLDLPISQAGALLRLLHLEWVSATYLFPGIDGVVRGLRERSLWDV